MGFNLDFTGDTEETLEQGGRVTQPGWYRATLADTYEHDDSGSQVLEFKIIGGPFDGSKFFEHVMNPDMATNEESRKGTEKRAKLIVSRLGIAKPGEQIDIDWVSAIGREYVLETKMDAYTPKQGKNAGQKVERVKVTYDGVYPPTHDRIPDDVRKALGLPPAAGKSGAGGAGGGGAAGKTVAHTPGPVNRAAGKDGTQAATTGTTTPPARPVVDVSNL